MNIEDAIIDLEHAAYRHTANVQEKNMQQDRSRAALLRAALAYASAQTDGGES